METVTRNIVRYLTQRGLLDRKAVVDGGLTVSLSRSRNRSVRIKQRSGPGYFIKQPLDSEPMSAETVQREAEIYRGAFSDDRLLALRSLLPGFHGFDEAQRMLVIDLVDNVENLADHHRRQPGCPTELAHRLGAAIASYHQIRFEAGKSQASLFPQMSPWIFDLPGEADVSRLRRSAASSAITDLVLQLPGLAGHLAALKAEWVRDTLIHMDMKWENCLLAPRGAPLVDQRLLVIDWELADIGDPAWDVAGILQAYLYFWVDSMAAAPAAMAAGDRGVTPDELAASATRPIGEIQGAIAAFWHGYAGARAAYTAVPGELLHRCVRMMAARMLVTAYEISVHAATVDPRALLLLQTAVNVFEQPARARRDLLGISDDGLPIVAAVGAASAVAPSILASAAGDATASVRADARSRPRAQRGNGHG